MAGQYSRPMPRPHASGSLSSGIQPQTRRSRGRFPGHKSRTRVPFPAPFPAMANKANAKCPLPIPLSGSPSPKQPLNHRSATANARSANLPKFPNFPISSPNNPHPKPLNPNTLPTQIPKWGKNENIPIQPIPRFPQTTAQPSPTREAQTFSQQLPSKDPHSSACFSLLPRGDTRNPPVP
jgi:hypothetical protein